MRAKGDGSNSKSIAKANGIILSSDNENMSDSNDSVSDSQNS